MPILVSCEQGHRWEVTDNDPGLVCPVCGEAARFNATDDVTSLPDSLTMKLPMAKLTESPAPPAPSAMPATIGSYQILQVLGRGGMGVVYKALQPSLKRVVALKMILQAGADDVVLKRFHTEAEAVARLQHPNIIQIHEIGEHEGRPFLSLEYVDGGTLAQRLARGLPMPREAAQLLEVLARAIDVAHQHGVIHRDLKPSNVLLTLDGQPKISDFGLAKRIEVDITHSSVTRTGDILGTPSYMAPEQAAGWIHAIGPATDVHALGVMLYEMLTGKPPFAGETALVTVHRVLNEDPLPPTALASRVPRDLETICLTCLAKAPRQRYASAAALADDLRAFLAGDPIQARPPTSWERLGRWAQRKPTTAVLVAVALAAFVGLLVGAWQFNALAVGCVAVLSMLAAAWWYQARLQSALRELAQEHRQAERHVERLHFLLEATRRLMAETDADALLAILGETSTRLVNAERATIYVLDVAKAELWSRVAMGAGVGEIRVPLGTGISGLVGLTGETIVLADPYSDMRFNPEVDWRTGYRTRNLLTMPVKSSAGKILGVFQLLNKREGEFNQGDIELLGTLAASSAVPLQRVGSGQLAVGSAQ